jgi:Fic family protein
MPGHYVDRLRAYARYIYALANYRVSCNYSAFIPLRLKDLPLNIEATTAGIVSEAEAAIRGLNESARPAFAPLARLLLRTESMASSKIEGVQTGVRELARAEAKAEAGQKVGETARQVLGNIDAMQLAMEEATAVERFGTAEIVAIHRRLMRETINAEQIAGQIRTSQNWIGGNDYNPCGADFVPPPPEEVQGLLEDLCDAINDERLPPIVQAAMVHAQFESIHPFADGNGRTGRALIHVVLKRRRVAPEYVPPISVVLAADRDRYIDGLTLFRADRTTEWIERFAGAARKAAKLAEAYLREVKQLTTTWRAKLSTAPTPPRADATAWALIDILPGYPVINAPVAAAVTARAKPRIYEALEQLEKAGVVAPLSASKRNRSWEAVGLLDLLEALEAGELRTDQKA